MKKWRVVTVACFQVFDLGSGFNHLPVHLTLVKPFEVADIKDCLRFVDELAKGVTAFRLRPVPDQSIAYFGSKNDQPVVRVEIDNQAVWLLHQQLVGYTKQVDPSFTLEYMGEAWSPHVSPELDDLDCRRLLQQLEQSPIIRELQTFYYDGPTKRLIARHRLSAR